jgi:hypothetical protein
MIDVLQDEGYQWVHRGQPSPEPHLPDVLQQGESRQGSYNIFSSPPNKADLLGPSPTGLVVRHAQRGRTAWNVAPFAYQLHRAKYVNPDTAPRKRSSWCRPTTFRATRRATRAQEGHD